MNPFKKRNRNTGYDDRQWVTVTETFGASQSKMIIEYLRDNGIHAVAIGSTSLGLITGTNSSARVMVPEEDVETAMYLLEPEAYVEEEEDNADKIDSSTSISDIHKAVLVATAIAFNPLGAGIAYAVSRTISSEDKFVNNLIDCPKCGIGLELSDDESVERQFVCPECDQVISLDDRAICPSCRSELELDADEQSRGWYICPECRWAIRIEHS